MPDVEIVELGRLTARQRAQLEGDEPDPFDARGLGLVSRPKDRHVALRDADGRLVASTGMLLVDVQVGGGAAFEVVGIGGVIVAAGHRGRGLARSVVEAALERAAERAPFALLFCHDDRAGLYARLGFEPLPPPVRVEQPGGEAVVPLRTMRRALREDARWPAGPVRVRSVLFRGAGCAPLRVSRARRGCASARRRAA